VVELAQEVSPAIQPAPHASAGEVQNVVLTDIVPEIKYAKAYEETIVVSRIYAPLSKVFFELLYAEVPARLKDSDDVMKKSVLNLLADVRNASFDFDEETNLLDCLEQYVALRTDVIQRTMKQADQDRELQRLQDMAKTLRIMYKNYHKRQHNEKLKDCQDLTEYIKRLFDGRRFKNGVVLDTIHSVKGLEADHVFILNYDKMPYCFKNASEWQMKQESNLLYVAITRAKKRLYLVESEG
jgi:superfamily I DNA/RNA helicase